jgi:hypothetical protein
MHNHRACPPCSGDCNQGRACKPIAGNYYAEYAENNFQHVHAPAPVAVVKPYTAPQDDEPLSDIAVAFAIVACVFAVAAVPMGIALALANWATVVAWIAP